MCPEESRRSSGQQMACDTSNTTCSVSQPPTSVDPLDVDMLRRVLDIAQVLARVHRALPQSEIHATRIGRKTTHL